MNSPKKANLDQGSDIYQYKSSFNQQEREELEDKKFGIKIPLTISPMKNKYKNSVIVRLSFPKIILEEAEEKEIQVQLIDDVKEKFINS